MNPGNRSAPHRWCLVFILAVIGAPALADVPLAGPGAERRARTAVPAAGEALLYVYRGEDRASAPLTLTLNRRDTVRLAPLTFVMWKVMPRRVDLAAEGTASMLTLEPEAGRVYYIELARTPSGVMLQTVTFATGRTTIQRARLVAPVTEVASTAPTASPGRSRAAGNGALMLKAGSFKLADESQTVASLARRFDGSSSSVYALEGEWFLQPGASLGLEVMGYSNEFTTPGGAGPGEVDTTVVLLNVKRYFRPGGTWQPYWGIGLGGVATEFTGSLIGNTTGPAVQAAAGMQWRGQRFALRAEYKYLSAETEDDAGETLDVSGGGFFLGAGFYF